MEGLRKLSRYVVATLLVVLALYWRPFAGQLAVIAGIITAGVAFAMQEVMGAVAGWFNILSGRIFGVGDRIEIGGVRGDVLDITRLRTKIMEMVSATDETASVRGRQYTGRVIAVSNKATFTEPVSTTARVSSTCGRSLRSRSPTTATGGGPSGFSTRRPAASRRRERRGRRCATWRSATPCRWPRSSPGSSWRRRTTGCSCQLGSSSRSAPHAG